MVGVSFETQLVHSMFMHWCFKVGKAPINTLFSVLFGSLSVHCV